MAGSDYDVPEESTARRPDLARVVVELDGCVTVLNAVELTTLEMDGVARPGEGHQVWTGGGEHLDTIPTRPSRYLVRLEGIAEADPTGEIMRVHIGSRVDVVNSR